MHGSPSSPTAMLQSFWRHRHLIATMATREIATRYRGSTMGLVWSVINPVFLLVIYTFVFSVVFKARWSVDNDSKSEFALALFAGLTAFNLFSECVSRAPSLILANVNYVKKVPFPLEILPLIALLSALFNAAISLCVWLIAYIFFVGFPQPTVLMLPIVLVPFVFFIAGLSWILCSLGVYLRDTNQIVGILLTVLMFLSPIFYPLSAVPEAFRDWMLLNPLAPAIEQARNILLWGKAPSATEVIFYWLFSSIFAWLGFAWFQKTRKGFADVL